MDIPDQLFGELEAAPATGSGAQFLVNVASGPMPRAGGAANVLFTVTATDTNYHNEKV